MAIEDPARMNTKVDPMLGDLSATPPAYVPGNATAVNGKVTPTFGDTTANYAGAFKPGDTMPWHAGWSAYPTN
jgi:hypothetical protein